MPEEIITTEQTETIQGTRVIADIYLFIYLFIYISIQIQQEQFLLI